MSKNRSLILKSSALMVSWLLVGQAMAGWAHRGERQVSFKAVGPGGLGIEGKGSDLTVKENGDVVVVTVGLNSLKTGIELRDRHMKEKYLETGKYPQAVFTVDKSKIKFPGEADLDGRLSLHGTTKPLRVHYTAKGNDKDGQVQGSAHVNMKDFGIEVPSYLGVTVKPDVVVSLSFGVENK